VVTACAACGQENPDGFRFCGQCGAELVAAAGPREVRKVVTVVFCDLAGSTALGDRTDPEALRTTMRAYFDEMRTILERHGGTVEKFVGDAVMAVFGVPVAHDEDALRAVRAAWEMRTAVSGLGLEARIGVNTGEVVAADGETLVTGDMVNVAARLEQAAEAGTVLIGDVTRRLVRDAVEVEPVTVTAKGKPLPVSAWRLVDLDPEASGVARRLDAPLIGRLQELDQLRYAFERSVREQRCHLFTLLGPAGVGKSRLVAEFLGRVDATVVEGRCLDYGEGITFWPVVSALKQLGARADETLARVVAGAAASSELFWSVRTLFEEVALERPLVVVFDDVHWGEPTFFDLIDHVADLSRGAPVLVLCVGRPELLDRRPGWSGGKLNATTVLLEPLSTEECAELIEVRGGVDAAARERILATADGNPLFVEEMVAFANENGDLRVPSTVHALLQARLDLLDGDERSVIERGAIEGQVFHRGAVLELARSSDVEPQLMGLVRKELIRPAPSTFAGDHAFRFRHLLIRDAAYDALPKEMRAELHEQFAGWLEVHGHDLIELDEVLGYHLEQAVRYRHELGQPSGDLAVRAGLHLAAAGTKAAARQDLAGTKSLLGRARTLLPDSPERAQATLELLLLLESASETAQRTELLAELEASADPVLAVHGRIGRSILRLAADPDGAPDDARAVAEEALSRFGGNNLVALHAQILLAWTSWLRSRAVDTVAAFEQIQEISDRLGVPSLAASLAVFEVGPLDHGPFTPAEVRAHIERMRADPSPLAQRSMLHLEGHLAWMDGRFDDARERLAQTEAISMQLGPDLVSRLGLLSERAEILAAENRLDESIEVFRQVDAELAEAGHSSFRSTVLINLAAVVYRRGDAEEAERLALQGEQLGAKEDVVNFAWGRGVRARVAADRGDLRAAEDLARDSVRYAYETDFPAVQADAHEALAYVLGISGEAEKAQVELEQALALWTRYGYGVYAERTRTALAELLS
jgi:class 3 adenylate cyclase/tetratricopeptide (TPR) repeat protein